MTPPLNESAHILIVLFGAIGDVVRALPVAVRIKQQRPQWRISWAVEPKSAGILAQHPAIDELILFDRARGLSGYFDFIRRLRKNRVDVVLDLQRHLKSGVTSLLSGAPRRIGFHRRNAKECNWLFSTETIPEVENLSLKLGHYQQFATALGVPEMQLLDEAGASFGLLPSREEVASVERFIAAELSLLGLAELPKQRRLGVILGASWPTKLWPHERYCELLRVLYKKHNMIGILVGGKTETAMARELQRELSVPVVNLVERLSLRELLALFHQVQLSVGPDTGPMHICAAAGTPVVSLWGATSARAAPPGSEAYMVQGVAPCSPCYKRRCDVGMICMNSITVADVLRRMEMVFAAAKCIDLGIKAQ